MYRTSARHEIAAAVVTFGVTAMVTAYLYLNVVLPVWVMFRPPLTDDYAEGPAEARMLVFSLAIGALCAFAVLQAARRMGLRSVLAAYVAPVALMLAGVMGVAMSLPPWYDRLWGEEEAAGALGVLVSATTIGFGLCMLARLPGAYAIGAGFATFGGFVNAGTLLIDSEPWGPIFLLALALYGTALVTSGLHVGATGSLPGREHARSDTGRIPTLGRRTRPT